VPCPLTEGELFPYHVQYCFPLPCFLADVAAILTHPAVGSSLLSPFRVPPIVFFSRKMFQIKRLLCLSLGVPMFSDYLFKSIVVFPRYRATTVPSLHNPFLIASLTESLLRFPEPKVLLFCLISLFLPFRPSPLVLSAKCVSCDHAADCPLLLPFLYSQGKARRLFCRIRFRVVPPQPHHSPRPPQPCSLFLIYHPGWAH